MLGMGKDHRGMPTLLVFVGDKDGVMGVDGAVVSRAIGILGRLDVLWAPSA